MNVRISPNLVAISDGQEKRICCSACSVPLAAAGSGPHWKHRATLVEKPCRNLPGWSSSVHRDLVLREFACPHCGHLLDSETALREDPFLYDTVEV